jgi:hypothetical protein
MDPQVSMLFSYLFKSFSYPNFTNTMNLPSAGIVTILEGVDYYIPSKEFEWGNENTSSRTTDTPLITAVTVFHFEEDVEIGFKSLESQVAVYTARDDVFNVSFLSFIIISVPTVNIMEKDDWTSFIKELCDRWGTQAIHFAKLSTQELPPGPYFLINENLHQAWKCYDDSVGAFTAAVVPSPSEKDS